MGFGEGGYRAALLSLWMTQQSPNNDQFDTFTYNAPGVYVKIQDEIRLIKDLLPEAARPSAKGIGHAAGNSEDGKGLPYADASKKQEFRSYIMDRSYFQKIYNYRHAISLDATMDHQIGAIGDIFGDMQRPDSPGNKMCKEAMKWKV